VINCRPIAIGLVSPFRRAGVAIKGELFSRAFRLGRWAGAGHDCALTKGAAPSRRVAFRLVLVVAKEERLGAGP
jgi:hypothetical protein